MTESSSRLSVGLIFPGCHRSGGVERSVWEASRWLSSRGHQVTVYARDADVAGLRGVRWRRIPASRLPNALSPLTFGRAVESLIERHDTTVSFGVAHLRADVLWVNSVHRAWLDAANTHETGRGVHHPRMRLLLPRHQVMLAEERRYFHGDPRRVVVVADQVGEDLARMYGVDPRRLATAHNGFSPEEFSTERSAEVRQEQRRRFGFSTTDVVAVMAANELPRKGFDVLLRAVAATGEGALKVLLVGKAAPQGYQALIQQLGLQGRVVYGGSMADMGLAYGCGDVFVLPTKYEAFCLAIVEALASGLPVITTTVPGAGDLITDGENGRLLSDPNDVEGLAKCLVDACDQQVRSRWAFAAAPSVAHLSWDQIFSRAEPLLAP